MSEVKKPVLGYADSYRQMARLAKAEGRHQMVDMFSVVTDLERNIAPLFDAAQSELAALREELASTKTSLEAVTLNLSRVDDCLFKKSLRLRAAEQRNAVLTKALIGIRENTDDPGAYECAAEALGSTGKDTDSQPTESGASE